MESENAIGKGNGLFITDISLCCHFKHFQSVADNLGFLGIPGKQNYLFLLLS